MQIQELIEQKLLDGLSPVHLDVINESHMHSVPANSETHFKVIIVSERFDGESLIKRHRLVNGILADELAGGVHALGLHTMTATEWEKKHGKVPDSPKCRGGSKG